MKKELLNWEKETNKLKNIFIKRYFGKDASDIFWVANITGEILMVNDYFFSLDRIIEAIRYNATREQLFDFYDLELATISEEKKMEIDFRNYVKLNMERNYEQ